MHVISIVNRKGGVGKTTTSVYLSLCLAKLGQRVLVVDLDPQGNATQLLIQKTFIPDDLTIGDVLTGDVKDLKDVVVASDIATLDVAPSSDRIKDVERRIDRYPLRDFLLKRALEKVEYDFVIIDTSPAADSNLVRNGLFASTHALIPIEAALLSMSGYVLALEDLDTLFQHIPEDDRPELLGPLLTRWDKRESVALDCQAYLTEHEDPRFPKARLFDAVIRTNTRLKNVVESADLRPRRKAFDDHMALAREIFDRLGIEAPQKTRKKRSPKKTTPKPSKAKRKPRRRVQRKRKVTNSKVTK